VSIVVNVATTTVRWAQ